MVYKTVITYTKSPGQMAREVKRAVKDANIKAVAQWHQDYLPLHFESSAMQRYRLGKRTEAYNRRKRRRLGAEVPLVFTGTFQRNVERSIRITATSKGARGRMVAPRYAHIKKGRRKRRPAEEILIMTKKEVETLAEDHGENVAKTLEKPAPERKLIR